MYSMNYIGKFIANFREFYNEINAATLTGAIDVIVVEQPDGSFTCSPFHVRFGKLGVLRSRFKVVDLELNGEPLGIHMKLGESGEAFFVEEMPEDEVEASAHLATSPIPHARFDELYEARRRNSLSAVEPDHSHASEYTKRRYTADGQSMQKPDLSKITKKESPKQTEKVPATEEHEALFDMEGVDDVAPQWTEVNAPKTFVATPVGEESEAKEAVRKISVQNDFRPIESQLEPQEEKQNGKKKKKTRKSSGKKKHQRKSSTGSTSISSSQSERACSEQRTPQASVTSLVPNTTEVDFYSDTELNKPTLSAEMSCMELGDEKRIPLALSDTAFELHAACRHAAGAGSRPGTPVQSDTEVELARASAGDKSTQSWRWGELPEPPPRPAQPGTPSSPASPESPGSPAEPVSSDDERRKGVLGGMFSFMSRETTSTDGVYLDELADGQVDPNLYFPKHHIDRPKIGSSGVVIPTSSGAGGRGPSERGPSEHAGPTEEEYESGNGPSLPQSPNSTGHAPIDSDDDEHRIFTKGYVGVYVREESSGGCVTRALPWEEWCEVAGALSSPNGEARLFVRLGDRYLPWATAAPYLLSLLAYAQPLPNRVVERLEAGRGGAAGSESVGAGGKARYSWWSWRRSNTTPAHNRTQPLPDKLEGEKKEAVATNPPVATPTETTPAAVSVEEAKDKTESENRDDDKTVNEDEEQIDVSDVELVDESLSEATKIETTLKQDLQGNSSSDSDEGGARPRYKRRHSSFRKTLRLSSDQIASLKLREGMNEMVFSVTTAYQGTTRCKCNVFRWRHDDKVVISDIDGTITKSDVLGHIFPLVGKDWAQSGVAQLFTKVKNNGYRLLYLSARAIGQARVTREYLRSIRQGEVCLPDGPLLLNPTSLLRAFHREVIEKKPEEFKIQCLADIKALFPPGSNPFYAGYGNRVNDVCAYQAVGIPIVRIFTINYKGELKHELTQTFQSTYSHMSVLVDQMFPPVVEEPCDEYSQAVYWRDPIPPLDLVLHSISEN